MKSSLYILELANGQYYIGSTSDLNRILLNHIEGKVISTKGKLPLKMVFHKEFDTLIEARQAEYKLKKYKSKKIIKQIVSDQQITALGS